MQTERVRVFEPDPAMPSGAVPIFGEYLDRIARVTSRSLVVSVFFLLFGIAMLLTGSGVAAPVFLVCFFGAYTVFWTYRALVGVPEKQLKRISVRHVLCEPDGLRLAGKTVGARLPDGRWLHVRLPTAWRLQLAGQRRLWLLGSGTRAFVGLPGNLAMVRARIRDEAPEGGLALPEVSREPTSPRLDPVLGAHRRAIGRALWIVGGWFVVIAGLGTWIALSFPIVALAVAVFALLVGMLFAAAARNGRPLAVDHWTELGVVLDGPVRFGRWGLARLSGRTALADGRPIAFRLVNADPSMVANIAMTGQLWIAGQPRRGKTAKTGVPGYPVTGVVRFR